MAALQGDFGAGGSLLLSEPVELSVFAEEQNLRSCVYYGEMRKPSLPAPIMDPSTGLISGFQQKIQELTELFGERVLV